MLLQDIQPYAIQAAAGREITQSALCVAVCGTSAAGNTTLTRTLFPAMVARGLLSVRTKGNAKYFTATQKGLDSLVN